MGNSLVRWLSNSAVTVAEDQLAPAFPLTHGEVCQGEQLSALAGLQSLQGFLSLAPLLRWQMRGPINASSGPCSEVDRCPLGTEHGPGPCRLRRLGLRLNFLASGKKKGGFAVASRWVKRQE